MLGSSRYTAVTKNLSLNEKEILIDNFSQKLSQKYNNLMHISNNVLKLLPDQTARRRLTRQVYFHTGTFTLNVRIPDKELITARFNSLNTSTDLSFFCRCCGTYQVREPLRMAGLGTFPGWSS